MTNSKKHADPRIILRIERVAKSTILFTGEENGVIADIGENGNIQFYNSIH